MTDMKNLAAALFAIAVLAPYAMAQSPSPMIPGGVEYDTTTGDDSLRITRTAPKAATSQIHNSLSTGVSSADFSSTLLPRQPQMAPIPAQPTTLQGAIQAIRDFAPYLHSTATQSVTQPPVPNVQVGAPYVWYQSALGGYWDASGTTKDVVRADKLYLYGGKFADGTPVPKDQIRDMNAMGHAFRQNELPTSAFWNH